MSDSPGPFLFAAVHKGPYLSIQPLEKEFGREDILYLVEGVSKWERSQRGVPYLDLDQVEQQWGTLDNLMRRLRVKSVIRSSSENVQERNVEELAAMAAQRVGIPVFVVEDFPGNYWLKKNERLDGLFVEDDYLVEVHQSRGVAPDSIQITGNPRYQMLSQINVDQNRAAIRHDLGLEGERVMLWAGQPDGENSFWALKRLFPGLVQNRVTLLFRAHQRDEIYLKGHYDELLAENRIRVVDVSDHPDVIGICCASDLVATQFSSVAVEASYLGVPALFVLFDDLGKQYLRAYKGYDTLPWHQNGCGFLITDESDIIDVLNSALFNDSSRNMVCANFTRQFRARGDCVTAIGQHIRSFLVDN